MSPEANSYAPDPPPSSPYPNLGTAMGDLFAEVFAESEQAIVVGTTDSEGGKVRALRANQAFLRLSGYEASEIENKALELLLAPAFHAGEWQAVCSQLAKAESFVRKITLKRADQTLLRVTLHGYPLKRKAQGSEYWALGLSYAPVPRQEATAPDSRSEELYQILASNGHDAITAIRFDGVCMYASPSIRSVTGYDPAELLGRSIESFFHPDDLNRVRRSLWKLFHEKRESTLTHRIRKKDGDYVWCETTTRTRRNIRGLNAGGLIAITRDISKRKRAETDLEAMHMLLSAVFETVPVGLCIAGKDGIIRQCNQTFADILGRPPSEICGKAAGSILGLDRLLAGSLNASCLRNNGESFAAHITVTPLYLPTDEQTLVTLADKTELLDIDNRLREAQRLESLGTLAGGIAHDFNNLLAIILGYASLLKQAAPDNPRIGEYGDTIIEAGRRGADVVKQLMLYANQHDPLLIRSDMHAILGDVLVSSSRGWPENIRLQGDFLATRSELLLDPEQIARAVEHLLQNARESISEAGMVRLTTADRVIGPKNEKGTHWLEVAVEDTGCGMDAATRERMFEPFFVHNKGPEVRGLGLALVYGIVRSHRGKIEVRSAPGAGTKVSMLFPCPLESSRPSAQKQVQEEYALKAGARVLLVEDEADIGKLWVDLLGRNGWTVHWAQDGEQALRLFSQNKDTLDLVFSDIGLPGGMDGWEVCHRIRAERPLIPVVLASGYFKRSTNTSPGLSDPVVCIDKPYQPMVVLDQMRKLLGQ